jgi:hypothetical protein
MSGSLFVNHDGRCAADTTRRLRQRDTTPAARYVVVSAA